MTLIAKGAHKPAEGAMVPTALNGFLCESGDGGVSIRECATLATLSSATPLTLVSKMV